MDVPKNDFVVNVNTWLNPEGERRFEALLLWRTTIYYTGYGATEAEAIKSLVFEAACHSEYLEAAVIRLTGYRKPEQQEEEKD